MIRALQLLVSVCGGHSERAVVTIMLVCCAIETNRVCAGQADRGRGESDARGGAKEPGRPGEAARHPAVRAGCEGSERGLGCYRRQWTEAAERHPGALSLHAVPGSSSTDEHALLCASIPQPAGGSYMRFSWSL